MKKSAIMIISLTLSVSILAHDKAATPKPDAGRFISFPDTADHLTLTVDLHTHSVFSDGHVWPRIRVGEALRDGLDGLAITEHLEWQPHLEDIPHPDRNRAFKEAVDAAEGHHLIVIPGSEITRDEPAGHMNAVFIKDANALIRRPGVPEPYDAGAYYMAAGEWPAQAAVRAANDQGAFVFWNHPFWTRQALDGIARIPDFHKNNAKKGLLHGIEIANGQTYSEEAFAIALKYDLALIGVSDVHDLIDWDYEPHAGGHRPVTLVLAKERSADAIREALFARRTLVWFKNQLFGRDEHLQPLLRASISVVDARYLADTSVLRLTIANRSDANFLMNHDGEYTFMGSPGLLELRANQETVVMVKPGKKLKNLSLGFSVLNALVAPGEPAEFTLLVRDLPD